jgi:hypothetical protein
MLLRSLLAGSVVLVGALSLGQGCGGVVAAGVDGGGSSGGSSSGGSSSGGSSSGGSSSGGPADTGPFFDAPIFLDAPVGPCEPDGVACINASQCCSAICSGSVCGSPVPTCLPDGSSCQDPSQCCSGQCSPNGICTPPNVACAVSSNANQCDVCLAMACCPQLSECQASPVCAKTLACFDACYKGAGTGVNCASQCGFMSSAQGSTLEQCGVSTCASRCQ